MNIPRHIIFIVCAFLLLVLGLVFFRVPVAEPALEVATVDYFEGVKGHYVRPADGESYPGVVMIHENRGLRPEIKQAAENLAKEGYLVLAVDLFDGQVLETQEQARAVTARFDQGRGIANMRAAAQYLRAQGAEKIASWGWCFGGRQSVNLSISGEPLDATVVYYGGGMATTTEALRPVTWPVFGVFGDADQAIPVATVRAFESSLNTLGIENEIHIYPGVGHAFANPSNPNHAPAETADAWTKTLSFLERTLKNIEARSEGANSVELVVSGLDTPWAITFLPNGDMLATERPGRLRVFGAAPATIEVPGVVERGEGGLLGIALHPDFQANRFLYLYYTTARGGETVNRVVRYVFDGAGLTEDRVIADNLPASGNHNGGRIAFGPDNLLYIATGDAGDADRAQDVNSYAGKILTVRDDGSELQVFSYGHRNPQGLAWDEQGNLWATEHGRSGVLSGYDELNFVERGANYGWPEIQGDETKVGMRAPAAHSGPTTTWAPAGLAYHRETLYFAGLRGSALYVTSIKDDGKVGEVRRLVEGYGRLRAVAVHDGYLYFSTSNRDGRGSPSSDDDRIFRMRLP